MKRTNTFFLTFAFGITSMLTAMLCACGGSDSPDTPDIPNIPVVNNLPCELMVSDGSWLWNRERSRAANDNNTYQPTAEDLLQPYESSDNPYKPSETLNGWMYNGTSWESVVFKFVENHHKGEYHYSSSAKGTGKVFIYDIANSTTFDNNPITVSLNDNKFKLEGLSDITTLEDDIRVATKATNVKNTKPEFKDCIDFTKNDEGDRSSRSCLEHIYSCLQIGFRVGSKYADLRYIHIKSVKIYRNTGTCTYTQEIDKTEQGKFEHLGGSKSYFAVPQVFIDDKTYAEYNNVIPSTGIDTDGQKMYPGLILGKGEGNTYDPTLFPTTANTQGKSLNGTDSSKGTDEKPFLTWGRVLFAPNIYSGFDLEIVYDVYTLHGQKTRYEVKQKVVDVNKFKIDGTEIEKFAAGSYYNILVDINPDYLYVLADDDISGHVVIKQD